MKTIFHEIIDVFEESTPNDMKQMQATTMTTLRASISLTAKERNNIMYAQLRIILSIT